MGTLKSLSILLSAVTFLVAATAARAYAGRFDPKYYSIEFDLKKIAEHIKPLRKMADFPLISSPYAEEVKRVDEPVPDDLQRRFRKLVHIAFNDFFPLYLRLCRDCMAASDVQSQIIYVDLEFLKRKRASATCSNPEDIIDFILAHEIGHYIYEVDVLRSPNNLSFYGQASMTRAKLLPRNANVVEIFKADVAYAQKHSEVDAIGAALMRPLHKDAACGVDLLVNDSSSIQSAEIDMRIREESLKRTLKASLR